MQSRLHESLKRVRSTWTTLRSDLNMQPGSSKKDVQVAVTGKPAKKKNKREAFSTFVFMDIETTGLITRGNNPKITELCLVSVQREELLDGNGAPRVLNKLVLCFNPRKSLSQTASEMTGLNNDNLNLQQVFSANTAQIIDSFLQHLPQPVCLLAHNGNRFDFPILMAELNEINQSLDTTLFCADTIAAFKAEDNYDPSSCYVSYKLENIYLRTFGERPQESHTAENDCMNLLHITQERGSNVLQWVDSNAVPFSTIPPAY
ncbi:hypothetical protein CHS0354_013588 [Potamilus streckersoni]|uniref:Exonuclease domain-containing protein n=1 Tax=Potamilus streckersoni TaxID=2493646 RepID=A0AAE0SKE7_9BIVA|nr:hypothetical protein CHS0354_013588 [Potamilus streckersoni]